MVKRTAVKVDSPDPGSSSVFELLAFPLSLSFSLSFDYKLFNRYRRIHSCFIKFDEVFLSLANKSFSFFSLSLSLFTFSFASLSYLFVSSLLFFFFLLRLINGRRNAYDRNQRCKPPLQKPPLNFPRREFAIKVLTPNANRRYEP